MTLLANPYRVLAAYLRNRWRRRHKPKDTPARPILEPWDGP